MISDGRLLSVAAALLAASCGAPPAPPQRASEPPARPVARAMPIDECRVEPGRPPPAPVRTTYIGLARAARCDREVYTIMGGVTHALGVECGYCHIEPDYTAPTHRKAVANWMARELMPSLKLRGAGELACKHCHAGRAKILGDPRSARFAIEWMTTHLVEELDASTGQPLRCRACHGGDLGSAEFRPRIILSELGLE